LDLLKYENTLKGEGYNLIAGVDEVGLGPIAGPLYAVAIILKDFQKVADLSAIIQLKTIPKKVKVNDSKQLSPQAREALYPLILENCLAYGVGRVEVEEINRVRNIMTSGYAARLRAVQDLIKKQEPDCILIDGPFKMNEIPIEVIPIVDGDAKSISIAAASVVAKVERDRIMKGLAKDFPTYDWENNMGYGTKYHYWGIKKCGTCIHHRTHLIDQKKVESSQPYIKQVHFTRG
jgi:ribonuclease HII